MEQDTAAQIEKRLAELPEDVRNAVMSVEWEQKVRAIGTKHALHIDQTGALGDTTLMARLANPWPGRTVVVREKSRPARKLKGDLLVWQAKRGVEYRIEG